MVDQEAFLKAALDRFEDWKPHNANNLAIPRQSLAPCEEKLNDNGEKFPYPSLMGSLLWISKTRPDVAHAVSQCCRFNAAHGPEHWKAALQILGYLRKFPDYGLEFWTMSGWNPGNPWVISSWADASWADDLVTHKSSYRYCVRINGCLVLWQFHLTPQVAHSMMEAEYVVMDEAAKEMVHLTMLLDWDSLWPNHVAFGATTLEQTHLGRTPS